MPRTKILEEKVELGLVLDKKQYEMLKRVSQKYGVSMSSLVRMLIERYIDTLES
jgi:antitoxin component of RelBE/YafQ-DinJ toxin-antitoxin module